MVQMGILGRKLGMTQIFDEQGRSIPVTVVEAGPCSVVAVKNRDVDGYTAVSLSFGDTKPSKLNKPYRGVFEKRGLEPKKWIREFRVDDTEGYEVGGVVSVELFETGDVIDVTGRSKGKGFAGVIKRHHFGGGPASHGASKFHRKGGSMGASSSPGQIFKGKAMPGRMGGERVTVKNLSVAGVDPENHLLLIRGAVPGPRNGLVMIRKRVGAAR